MSDTSQNNKRIALNTLFLYFRMILVMFVSLYTSRIVLQVLGIEDFGIFNIVGGVIAMFSFFNSSMSSSTQRFLTFCIGRNDESELRKTFSASMNVHIIIAIIVFVLVESIGLWYVNNKLVIPTNRLFAANVIFQTTLFSLIINIIQVPYNALIIAYEKMNIYAYISIIEVILKLAIVFVMKWVSYDKLSIYGILLLIVQYIITSIYRTYCKKKYPSCVYKFIIDKPLYSRLIKFASLNLFGSLSWLFRAQGVNILLNLFFGPLLNAARGIAFQVNSAVNNFISGFQTALNPQITKCYAVKDINRMEALVYKGIKYSFFLLYLLTLPIILNTNFILNLWLTNVPQFTGIFLKLVLIDSLISNLFGGPLMTSLAATGNIKKYQIFVSSIMLLTIPIVYIAFKLNAASYYAFIISIIISLIAGIVRLYFCKKQIGFSIIKFVRFVIFPAGLIGVLSPIFPVVLYKYVSIRYNQFSVFIISSFICIIISLILIYYIGINKQEKNYIKSSLKKIKVKICK